MPEHYPDRLVQRRGHDPFDETEFGWYGNDPVFRIMVERNLRAVCGVGRPARGQLLGDRLVYVFGDLEVPGDLARHDLKVVFRPGPLPAWASGIAACDYPSVYTSVDRPRKHFHSDGALCLWASFDPPERRWWHGDGLLPLVELARRHLFFELHWWRTGGGRGGEWLGDEAPHGVPAEEVA